MAKTDLQNVADDLYLVVKKGIQLFDEFWGWLYLPICLSIYLPILQQGMEILTSDSDEATQFGDVYVEAM